MARPIRRIQLWRPCIVLATVGLLACSGSPTDLPPGDLAVGTWGGNRVGVIVSAVMAHVHVNCTNGDFPAPVELDTEGRFSVSGSYLVKAYPIAIGPTMPAEFTGVVDRNRLTFTVVVNDTIEQTQQTLGPVTAVLGEEAEMGPCPICVDAHEDGVGGGWWSRGLIRVWDWLGGVLGKRDAVVRTAAPGPTD